MNTFIVISLALIVCTVASAQDPCAKVITGFKFPVLEGADAYKCLRSIDYDQTSAQATLDTVGKYLEAYSYVDYNINSGPPYNVKVDIENVLTKVIPGNTYKYDMDFQEDLAQAFVPAHDAHTQYRKPACYGGVWLIPLQLGSFVDTDGKQAIRVIPPFSTFKALQPAYSLPRMFDGKYSTLDWSSLEGVTVTSINGVPAMTALTEGRRLTTDTTTPARVRYAPSPTGELHLGGLRTALFNYLLARQTKGQFILRIEDTDRTREVPGATAKLEQVLSTLGLEPDEGPGSPGPHAPYIQSQRTELYKTHAADLLAKGAAYRCFCPAHRLDALRTQSQVAGLSVSYDRHCHRLSHTDIADKLDNNEPHTLRLLVPKGETTIHDAVRGNVRFQNTQIDDQILLKSDGFPTYHLASVVDDHLMEITHVIRGEEWLASTPKHLMLYDAFGWKRPVFAHLPLLLNTDRTKLSKRQGDVSVESFLRDGYTPETLLNFVLFLGWNPGTTQELFTLDEAIDAFRLEGLSVSGAVVNRDKLDWYSGEHFKLATMDPEHRARLAASILPDIHTQLGSARDDGSGVDVAYVAQCCSLMAGRIRKPRDLITLSSYLFRAPDPSRWADEKFISKLPANMTEVATLFLSELDTTPNMKSALDAVIAGMGLKAAQVQKTIRFAATGELIGASVGDTLEVLGRAIVARRVLAARDTWLSLRQ